MKQNTNSSSSITCFVCNRIKLRVNQSKNAVDIPVNRQFLRFTLQEGKLQIEERFLIKRNASESQSSHTAFGAKGLRRISGAKACRVVGKI